MLYSTQTDRHNLKNKKMGKLYTTKAQVMNKYRLNIPNSNKLKNSNEKSLGISRAVAVSRTNSVSK
jgi:hypothetical protein